MKKLLALIMAVSMICLCGCGMIAQTSGEPVSQEPPQEEIVERTITISCAGDCTLGTDSAFGGRTLPVEVEAQGRDFSWFFKNVKPIFEEDDLTIVNLEGTLTTGGTRQDKTFAFRGDPSYVKILTEGSVEAVTLANNHSMDYGEISLSDTKDCLDNAGIVWFENLNTAVMEINDIKVGLIGLYALNGSAEGNLPKAMADVKAKGAELVVVQIHWGIEGNTVPDTSQISLAHSAVDMGAHLVIGHHPHVMQGIEEYKGRTIVYSLGNFCFGGNQNPRDKDTMIYQQTFTFKNAELIADSNWQVHPCRISSVADRNNYQPTPSTGDEAERIREKIQKMTEEIGGQTVKFAGISNKTPQQSKYEQL